LLNWFEISKISIIKPNDNKIEVQRCKLLYMQRIKNTHALSILYVYYICTHTCIFLHSRSNYYIGLNRWNIKWQIKSMNSEINIMFCV
jgi:hypothetical protein